MLRRQLWRGGWAGGRSAPGLGQRICSLLTALVGFSLVSLEWFSIFDSNDGCFGMILRAPFAVWVVALDALQLSCSETYGLKAMADRYTRTTTGDAEDRYTH